MDVAQSLYICLLPLHGAASLIDLASEEHCEDFQRTAGKIWHCCRVDLRRRYERKFGAASPQSAGKAEPMASAGESAHRMPWWTGYLGCL